MAHPVVLVHEVLGVGGAALVAVHAPLPRGPGQPHGAAVRGGPPSVALLLLLLLSLLLLPGVALDLSGQDVPLGRARPGGQADLEAGRGRGRPPDVDVHVVTIRLAANGRVTVTMGPKYVKIHSS